MDFFEITKEDGLSRRGRIQFSKNNAIIKTPSLILPVNSYLLKIEGYRELIRNNKNVILQIFDPSLVLPEEFRDYNIISALKSNYYYSDLSAMSYFFEDSTLGDKNNIEKVKERLYLASKNCPATAFDDRVAIINKKEYTNELSDELNSLKELFPKKFRFGMTWAYWGNQTIDAQTQIFIDFMQKEIVKDNIRVLNIKGLFDNWMNFREITNTILKIKNVIPSDTILMASGNISPSILPFLVYLGFDMIDGTYLIQSGFSDLYFTDDSTKWARQLLSRDDLPCSCSYCQKLSVLLGDDPGNTSNRDYYQIDQLLGLHNLTIGLNLLRKSRSMIKEGDFRRFLERSMYNSTFMMSALRYLDIIDPNPIQLTQPLNKSSKLICSSSMSYFDPQVTKFQDRVKERCFPLKNSKIAILLPCSMGKPYSKSKSHRRFIKIMKNALGSYYKQCSEAIITSPLGLVPREVEIIYPAAHYDISVTGEWDAKEVEITADCITDWIKKFPVDIPVIAYLDGGYKTSLEAAKIDSDRIVHIVDNLDSFKEILEKYRSEFDDEKSNQTVKKSRIDNSLSTEEKSIKMIADFQFGQGAGELLIGDAVRFVPSRDDRYKEILGYDGTGKIMLGRVELQSGSIRLSNAGAERISELDTNSLILNTTDLRGSTVFSPALKNADQNLCSGDEVIFKKEDGKYFGVGNMVVSGKTAMKLRSGAIAKIRKKKK